MSQQEMMRISISYSQVDYYQPQTLWPAEASDKTQSYIPLACTVIVLS